MPYNYQKAIQSGASEDQVLDYLNKTRGYNVEGALKAGASKTQLIDYLSKTQIPDHPVAEPPKKSFFQKASDTITSLFPGKKVGEAIGTLGGLGSEKVKGAFGGHDNSKFYDTSAPTPLQVGGDIAQGALSIAAPEIGRSGTILGKVGANAALGAGIGATGAVANKEKASDVLKQGALGGALGGGASAVGEGINSLSRSLPRWLTKAALPKLDSKNIDYALENSKLGGLKSIARKSSESLGNYENQIQTILSAPQHLSNETQAYTPATLLGKTLKDFPDSEYNPNDIIKNAKNIAPRVGGLLTKLEQGTANIQQINSIRKELDSATKSIYTSINRPPESKMLGASLSNTLRDYVQTNAPATVPIFHEYAKEIGLHKAIQAAFKKGEQKIHLKDLIAAGSGFAAGGLSGALKAVIAERVLTSPGGQIGTAKILQGTSKIAQPIIKNTFQATKSPLIKKLVNKNE